MAIVGLPKIPLSLGTTLKNRSRIHAIGRHKPSLTLWHLYNALLHTNITSVLSKFFYSPTDAQVNCLKNNFKIYIKINIKTAPTCLGAVTPSSESALLVLAKVTVVKTAN
jgi:hypothetical protein